MSVDEVALRVAIEESQKAVDAGCMPFGATLANSTGEIICRAHNGSKAKKERGGAGDVTRHAEMELVRKISTTIDLDTRKTCTLYTSTEPCVMCAGAIYWSGVSRIVYGASAQQLEALSGPGGFDIPIEQLYGMNQGIRPMTCIGPLLSEEAMKVHQESGIWKGCSSNTNNSSPAIADIETERSLKTLQ